MIHNREYSPPHGRAYTLRMDYKKLSGARIREGREEKGLGQAALADLIGVEPSAVGNYEQGLRYPKPNILQKLSKILEIPVSYLSGLEPDKRAESLILLYAKLDKRGKETLIRVAEAQQLHEEEPEKAKK